MHLGNGALTPGCAVVALGTAAIGGGVAWLSLRRQPQHSARAWLACGLSTAVFAAQMFNVPILPHSSGHLVGGVLLAWMLGAPLGVLCMSAILMLQAALLGDGGAMALGANILNMAIIPACVTALARRRCRGTRPLGQGSALAAASLLSVVAGAALVVLEVAAGRSASQLTGLGTFAGAMLKLHLLLGVFEVAVTVPVVWMLGGSSDWVNTPAWSVQAVRTVRARAATAMFLGLLVAALSLPNIGLASTLPDGYESAVKAVSASNSALHQLESTEYLFGLNAQVAHWQAGLVRRCGSGNAAALGGAVLAGMLAFACARGLPGRACNTAAGRTGLGGMRN